MLAPIVWPHFLGESWRRGSHVSAPTRRTHNLHPTPQRYTHLELEDLQDQVAELPGNGFRQRLYASART